MIFRDYNGNIIEINKSDYKHKYFTYVFKYMCIYNTYN